MRFLDDRGSLSGEPLEELEQACAAFSEEFHERAGSPESWGLAKSMAMQMFAEGIDPTERGAMEAWISDFNARPQTDRDAVVGGAERILGAAKPGPGSHPQPASQRRTQRKAQRAARKRSRRRAGSEVPPAAPGRAPTSELQAPVSETPGLTPGCPLRVARQWPREDSAGASLRVLLADL